jgi:hypothetical protein
MKKLNKYFDRVHMRFLVILLMLRKAVYVRVQMINQEDLRNGICG